MNCMICGAGPNDRPAINKNEPYCSEVCRKKCAGEIPLVPKDLITMSSTLFRWLVEIGQHAYLRDPGMGETKDGSDNVINTFPFHHEKFPKAGVWLNGEVSGRPRWHQHTGSGIKYPAVNTTVAGDEVEHFTCVECGADTTSRIRTDDNRDED